jgi:hypothetical protein
MDEKVIHRLDVTGKEAHCSILSVGSEERLKRSARPVPHG